MSIGPRTRSLTARSALPPGMDMYNERIRPSGSRSVFRIKEANLRYVVRIQAAHSSTPVPQTINTVVPGLILFSGAASV